MEKILFEVTTTIVAITLALCCIGLTVSLAVVNQEKVKYQQAACILNDVCRMSLDSEHLDQPGFEDRYYDTLDNLDCYNMKIDREFVESLSWCY